jgi:hypothetical protein
MISLLVLGCLSAFAEPSFQCAQETAERGTTCVGRIAGYPREVALIVPPGFSREADFDLVLYLHGNNRGRASLQSYLTNFDFSRHLATSGRNALMAIPLSWGNPSDPELARRDPVADQDAATIDYKNVIAHRSGYDQVLAGLGAEVVAQGLADNASPRSIVVAVHSGGYRTAAAIAGYDDARVEKILLLDATYGRQAAFIRFASQPGHRLWSVHTPHLDVATGVLRSGLDSAGITHAGCVPTTPGCERVRLLDPAMVAANAVGVVAISGTHDEAVTLHLSTLLSAFSP